MAQGYGGDTWCADSYSPGRFARGATAVVQALYRRLITPRGTLRGGDAERAYGLDLAGFIGAMGDSAGAALPGAIRAELLKDDRVADVTATAARTVASSGLVTYTIEVTGELHDEQGDFRFSVSASDVTVELVGSVS